MELLHSDLVDSFADGLSLRIGTEEQYTLLPLVGALGWLGKICFASIYVDSKNPSLVTKVLLKSMKTTSDDVEAKTAEGVDGNSIFERWKQTMDSTNTSTNTSTFDDYVLFLWVDQKVRHNVSLFKSLIDDRDLFTIKSSEYSLVDNFYRSYPNFQQKRDVEAYVCVLKDKHVHFPCPGGYLIKCLSLEDTNTAMSSYKFASEIRNNLLLCTANGFGVGAYHVGSKELASCVFVNWDGSISGLQTFDAHRRKGLACAVVTRMVEMLAEKRLPVFCFIEKDVESTDMNVNLYRKLGFETQFDTIMAWR